MLPSRDAFARRLARLDRGALAAFVAALHRSRGREATAEGPLIRLDGAGRRAWYVADRGVAARLRGALRGGRRESNAEVLVVPERGAGGRRPDGLRVVDADELYDLALYGLDRADCEAQFRAHLGCGLADLPAATATGRRADTAPVAHRRRREVAVDRGGWTALLPASLGTTLTVLVVVVLVAGLLVPPWVVGVGGGSAAAPLGGGSDTPVTAADTDASDAANVTSGALGATTPTPTPDRVEREQLAPGLSPTGVDLRTLTTAHVDAVTRSSYRWELSTTEYENGSVTASTAVEALVASPDTYRAEHRTEGDPRYTTLALPNGSEYADGVHRYRRVQVGGNTTYERTDVQSPPGRFASWSRHLIYLALDSAVVGVVVSDTRDGRTVHRVRGSGRTSFGWLVDVLALVDERGVVHRLDASFTEPGTYRTVHIGFEFTFLENATIERPDWYAEARYATADSDGDGDPG